MEYALNALLWIAFYLATCRFVSCALAFASWLTDVLRYHLWLTEQYRNLRAYPGAMALRGVVKGYENV